MLIQKEEQINNMKEKLRSKNKILSSILSSQHKKDFAIQRQRNQLYTLMDDLSMKDQIIAVKKNNIDYVIDKEPFTLHSGLAHPSHTMKVSVATMTTGLSREVNKTRILLSSCFMILLFLQQLEVVTNIFP